MLDPNRIERTCNEESATMSQFPLDNDDTRGATHAANMKIQTSAT